jgi:hypothetical protein
LPEIGFKWIIDFMGVDAYGGFSCKLTPFMFRQKAKDESEYVLIPSVKKVPSPDVQRETVHHFTSAQAPGGILLLKEEKGIEAAVPEGPGESQSGNTGTKNDILIVFHVLD